MFLKKSKLRIKRKQLCRIYMRYFLNNIMGCSSSNSSVGAGADGGAGGGAKVLEQLKEPREKSAKSKEESREHVNYPPSEAYVISFDTDENSPANQSIVTTSTWNSTVAAAAVAAGKTETFHPPERLQKALEEQQTNANFAENVSTIETITEKLEKAEQRRQAIIQQKIEKAQKLMKNMDETIHENMENVEN